MKREPRPRSVMDGAEMRAQRKALGITRAQAAALMCTTVRAIDAWESNSEVIRGPIAELWRIKRDVIRFNAAEATAKRQAELARPPRIDIRPMVTR